MTIVKFKKLVDNAVIPQYMTAGAAGLDLSSVEEFVLPSRVIRLVHTGIAVEIEPRHMGLVLPRSGLALNHGITVLNSPGLIDSDYRGEICVLLVNHGTVEVGFVPGDRIAQLVISPAARAFISDSQILSETDRSESGFGSSGR